MEQRDVISIPVDSPAHLELVRSAFTAGVEQIKPNEQDRNWLTENVINRLDTGGGTGAQRNTFGEGTTTKR